jgi:hypothetical protein
VKIAHLKNAQKTVIIMEFVKMVLVYVPHSLVGKNANSINVQKIVQVMVTA